MYYNVTFFFEKPLSLFTTDEETEFTVSEEVYRKYASGDYIKGEDGEPLLVSMDYNTLLEDIVIPPPERGNVETDNLAMSEFEESVMSAIAELGESLAVLMEGMGDNVSP